MKRGWLGLLVVVLATLVLTGVGISQEQGDGLFALPGRCTAFAVRPTLVVTASHCVGEQGTSVTVQAYNGQTYEAKVVWDGPYPTGVDLAFLRLPESQMGLMYLAESVPDAGAEVVFLRWIAQGQIEQHNGTLQHRDADLEYPDIMGKWGRVLVVLNETSRPGFSGGPLLYQGRVIGVGVIIWYYEHKRGFIPLERLNEALQDLDAKGDARK